MVILTRVSQPDSALNRIMYSLIDHRQAVFSQSSWQELIQQFIGSDEIKNTRSALRALPCSECSTVPRVTPTTQSLFASKCSIATETATISPCSTWLLHASTPGTKTYANKKITKFYNLFSCLTVSTK